MRKTVLSLTVLSLACGQMAHAAIPVATLPTGPAVGDQELSPFYRWSGVLPQTPGTLLRSEVFPKDLTPAHAGVATRLLYTSEDVHWNSGAVPVSGVLYLPQGSAPQDGWPLIVWAHGTVGMADSCAPSWAGPIPRDKDYIDRWLAAGYAVVASDYQGLGGPGPQPYTDWRAEGRSLLDSARAALRADKRIANRMVISGQSQGSNAAFGAARLAATYAPELNVKATIATASANYMPDPGTPPETISPGGDAPHFMMYRMLGGGLPDATLPDALLTEKGRVLMAAIRTGCAPRPVAEREGVTLANAFTVPAAEINLKLGALGQGEPFKAGFPIFIGAGLADELIGFPRQMTAVKAMCQAGNTLVLKAYPKARHGETLTQSFDDAHAFVTAVMTGASLDAVCTAGT